MILMVVIAMTALMGVAALALDGGMIWVARTQLQVAADAAALAAAANMIDPLGPSVTLGAAETAAIDVASQNPVISVETFSLNPSDIVFGSWDLDARIFDPTVDLTDPKAVTAASVTARLDNGANGALPAVMARVLGWDSFDVGAEAIAYLSFAGSAAPGEVDLPLVIDCSEIAGSDCSQPYCSFVANNPPNYGDETADYEFGPCELADGTAASCLDTHKQVDQVACWTNFSDSVVDVDNKTLIDTVYNGTSQPIAGDASWFVDNGTRVEVYQAIYDRMHGVGKYSGPAAGQDTDGDGVRDSWVVRLPVVESQEWNGCERGGQTWDMVGFVCFEIQEVVVEPNKRIMGRFVCPQEETDPRYDKCSLGGVGGEDFGVFAKRPVLVR